MHGNVFDHAVTGVLVARIDALTPQSRPLWGKMNVGQMLAHCCVPYEMIYDGKHRRPAPPVRLLLKLFVKPSCVNDKPYPRGKSTAPAFIIRESRDFAVERDRLIAYLRRTQELGGDHFDGLESLSFGPLTRQEWSTLFHKHLDHHLRQFGV
jgi:hypothetical protein